MAVPPVDQEPTEQVNSLSHLDLSSSHADKNSLDIKTAEKQATVTAETKVEYIQDLLAAAKHTYTVRNTNSLKLHQLASKYLPGGNTRSVLFTDPFPLCMEQGYGNRLIDSDGHEYLDLIGEMTAGLYGHSHPIIRDAIVSAAYKTGLNLGATTTAEAKFADQICQRIPSIEQLRFCNSGTEANLYALSIARRVTGRSKVVVFTGGYHGGVLSFVHGIAANNVDKADWILGTYNNGEAARKLISENKDTAAAVLVEAMQGAGGCIQGTAGFLHAIQQTAKETGVIFILDEVMTSRLAPGGLQSTTFHPASQAPLHPDITTLGKYIAGGITIGAFGGRSDLLAVYNPRAVVASGRGETLIQHSGTFNNNTIAMSVGYVALSAVYTSEACIALNSLGDWFRRSLQELCQGKKMIVTGVGAVCNIHFLSCSNSGFEDAYVTRVTCTEELEAKSGSFESFLKDLLWFYVVERGYWMAQRGMLSLTLGTTMEELQGFLQVIEGFLNEFDDFVK